MVYILIIDVVQIVLDMRMHLLDPRVKHNMVAQQVLGSNPAENFRFLPGNPGPITISNLGHREQRISVTGRMKIRLL